LPHCAAATGRPRHKSKQAKGPTALTRIAHHYFESATLGHCEKAIDFSFRAAEAADAVHAYEDAVVHYDHALSLLDFNGSPDDERIARAFALKGQALLCIGRVAESTESLVKAIDSNHRLGDIEQLVDVVSYLTILTSQAPQQQQYPLLERLLSLLPKEDSPSRATVIAGLAFATRASGERDRVRSLVDEALGIVERLGENSSRCSVLNLCSMALRGDPENLPRRLELGTRHLQSAHTEDSAFLKAEAYSSPLPDHMPDHPRAAARGVAGSRATHRGASRAGPENPPRRRRRRLQRADVRAQS